MRCAGWSAPGRYLPNDFPPWAMVYQQTQRWIVAGGFEAIVHDLRALLRVTEDRASDPRAVVLDGRTRQKRARAMRPAVDPEARDVQHGGRGRSHRFCLWSR